ncbi:sulfatase-like hydrolase/transferase [Paenibacillus qinlingensis]|uniref:Choline-sulfatase n=1 Tax=Paenibacillus qinlingensis TaxID=1837343 RepID=A0ABU1NWC0_9BACL|nr:sulfatase-like hydrolase/transferase [Paenibacillus qinlingensis]MDR6551756.1 choline-sulfatase [Paenibacillus qinlingensis]
MRSKPNILIVMSDEHAAHATGCYGHLEVKTPHMDRLAAEGIRFDNAYCNSPMCVPSRMSFLTGQHAFKVGGWDNGSPLSSVTPTFAHYFEAAGYESVLCGRMHMVGEDRLHGFGKRLYDDMDSWKSYNQTPKRTPEARRGSNSHVTQCGPGQGSWQEYDANVADLTVRYLTSKAAAEEEKPWLMVSGLMFPHFPLIAPPAYYRMYDPQQLKLPSWTEETLEDQHPAIRQMRYAFRNDEQVPEETVRTALASYYALITLVDDYLGRMLDVIDGSSLKDNTIVVYISDHGEMAGQHGIWQKQCFYESSVKIPMIIRLPESLGGRSISHNVSLVDLIPTIMELAGIQPPSRLSGQSLLPLIQGDLEGAPRVVFSEYHAQGMLQAAFMVKKDHFKYNYYVEYPEQPELFQVDKDPGELVNLAGRADMAGKLQEMHRELLSVVGDPAVIDEQARRNQEKSGISRCY